MSPVVDRAVISDGLRHYRTPGNVTREVELNEILTLFIVRSEATAEPSYTEKRAQIWDEFGQLSRAEIATHAMGAPKRQK